MKRVEVPISADIPGGGRETHLITVLNVAEHDTIEATTRKAVELATQYGYKNVRSFFMDELSKQVLKKVKEKYGISLDEESVVDAVQEIQRTGGDRIVQHGEDEYTLFISADRSTIFVAKDVLTVSKDG